MDYTKLYLKKIRRSFVMLAGALVAVLVFMYFLSDLITELEGNYPLDGDGAVTREGYVGHEQGGGVTVVAPPRKESKE